MRNVLRGKWKVSTGGGGTTVTDYTPLEAQEFAYDSPRARWLSRASRHLLMFLFARDVPAVADKEELRRIEAYCVLAAQRPLLSWDLAFSALFAATIMGTLYLLVPHTGVMFFVSLALSSTSGIWLTRRLAIRRVLPRVLHDLSRCSRCGYPVNDAPRCTECGHSREQRA